MYPQYTAPRHEQPSDQASSWGHYTALFTAPVFNQNVLLERAGCSGSIKYQHLSSLFTVKTGEEDYRLSLFLSTIRILSTKQLSSLCVDRSA